MKMLVTEKAGFIGFYLAKKLLDRGDTVVWIDNINDYYDVNLKYGRLKELGINCHSQLDWKSTSVAIQSTTYKNHKFYKIDLAELNNKITDIIEKYGSGVKRVIKLFKEYGSKEPLFEDRLGGMVVVVYKKEHFKETTQETTQEIKKLSTRKKIIKELKNNSFLTRDDLPSKIGVSSNAIKQHLAKLKSDGIIKRIGSTKSGYWEVLRDGK